MNPKTERFEMRLDPAILERVDEWRIRQEDIPSRAEAFRRLIENGFPQPEPNELHLTKAEKLILWLLSEILLNQKDGKRKDDAELIQAAIYGGHLWALEWELDGLFNSKTVSKQTLNEVVDILDMWSLIERSYKKLSVSERKKLEKEIGFRGKDPHFRGFDGNYEVDHMSTARFLVEHLGRFQDFAESDMNSHMPVVKDYLAMYDVFKPLRSNLQGRGLNLAELAQILKAEAVQAVFEK